MGVSGLFPFLKKTCPNVIKILPNRLKDLSGKIIAIDGTLVTQRLHYASVPVRKKHVLGWYRLMQDFKKNNIQPICIFDGKERHFAKFDELARRRYHRQVNLQRKIVEFRRYERLNSLKPILDAYCSPDDTERQRAAKELLALSKSKDSTLSASSSLSLEKLLLSDDSREALPMLEVDRDEDEDDVEFEEESDAEAEFEEAEADEFDTSDTLLEETSFSETVEVGLTKSLRADKVEPLGIEASPEETMAETSDDEVSTSSPDIEEFALGPNLFERSLLEVYVGRDIVDPEVLSTPSTSPPLEDDKDLAQNDVVLPPFFSATEQEIESADPDDISEESIEVALSKSQNELTMEEEKFWEHLAKNMSQDDTSLQEKLVTITQKSQFIAQNYARRAPPTEETYKESREIIEALGIPCIMTTGLYEAEALASSLVLNGHADFVASEDTDVLIYGAPLVRNITNSVESLVVVNEPDVRTALELEREQFIDFALLLGTDFSRRIKFIGPMNSLKFIRQYGCIERIIEENTTVCSRVTDSYLQQIQDARSIFTTLPPIPESAFLQSTEYDPEVVLTILQEHGLQGFVDEKDWDSSLPLKGNFFNDNPHTL